MAATAWPILMPELRKAVTGMVLAAAGRAAKRP